jgi:plasmid replication initiation protein
MAIDNFSKAQWLLRANAHAHIEKIQQKSVQTLFAECENDAQSDIETEKPKRPHLLPVRHPQRDFFLCDMLDYAFKDDGVSMEAPLFTLATKPDTSIWEWTSKDGNRYVKVFPSVIGRATQFDKDVLIYVISQMTAGLNSGREDAKSRTVRFTVYDYLVATNRNTGGKDYAQLHAAFERLTSTRISTDIKTGGQRIRETFGIFERAKIVEKQNERMVAVEVTLSEWLYNAVQAHEVLTINPDYFRLRKSLERRLYELARKHCGNQSSWSIGLDLLHEKTGSKSLVKKFKHALKEIEKDGDLLDYKFSICERNIVTFIQAKKK